ncbi:sterol desaturase family protein [Ginsengibacter hankyongi]|uniref:Sterol desaturase family protein n=1 Tax=Ginsengibacter hankyongi TaxID=2607284 RepID=A0A5J5IF81_9BACT|nr:sterol desaturase family protein [Ginsengibacter hankyongi]KAA9038553.1 sterol desaturase family protein [Ginsengibacter hankyongi]
MHHLITFLSHSSDETEALTFSLALLVCWNIERMAGLAVNYTKLKHAFLNAQFILTGLIPQFVTGYFFVKAIRWTTMHNFGILHHLPYVQHPVILFLMSFVFLDLGEYIYHVIMHKVDRLWMFHAVHHCDHIVDVSTTLREHPCENLIRNLFTIIWIFFSGALFWTVFLRQLIQIFSNLLAHMNYRLPEKLDSIIGLVFITPNLHQVHHHYQRPNTDSNYGDVLSIWDRLFGTFNRVPYKDIVFGVDTYMDQQANSKYLSLLKLPFGKIHKRKLPVQLTENEIN